MNELGVTDFILNAWTPIKELFSNICSGAIQGWNLFTAKLQDFGIIDTIKQKWQSLKGFFKGIFDCLSPIITKVASPLKNVRDGTKTISSKIMNFFKSEKTTSSSQLKIPDLKTSKPNVSRNQNNNFNITINAGKNENAETIANKVVNRVSSFSKTFLFDEVGEVI